MIINAMEWGRKAVSAGSNLEARTQVQWASILALNGWVQAGTGYFLLNENFENQDGPNCMMRRRL